MPHGFKSNVFDKNVPLSMLKYIRACVFAMAPLSCPFLFIFVFGLSCCPCLISSYRVFCIMLYVYFFWVGGFRLISNKFTSNSMLTYSFSIIYIMKTMRYDTFVVTDITYVCLPHSITRELDINMP